MKYRVKKIWQRFVTVRSTVVEKCIEGCEDLTIQYLDEEMTVPIGRLLHPLQLVPRTMPSKFHGAPSYKLYDFKWQPKIKVAATLTQGQLF